MELCSGSGSEISRYSDCFDRCAEQKSTVTLCGDAGKIFMKQAKVKGQSDSEEINQQNICNKRSEKLNKPCQNGFCYCFTSDSDQQVRKRKPKTKLRKHSLESSISSQCSGENSTETSDFSDLVIENANHDFLAIKSKEKQYNHRNQSIKHNYLLTAKTSLDENINAPLIHIVQEIHEDRIISEVKINKQKMIDKKQSSITSKGNVKKSSKESQNFTKKTQKGVNYELITDHEPYKSRKIEENQFAQKETDKIKLKNPRAGQLLKRRVSDDFYNKAKSCNTPPKKPPRRFSETNTNSVVQKPKIITNLIEAEVILNKFLNRHGHNFEKEIGRKPFALEKANVKREKIKPIKIVPSCPSFREFGNENDVETNIEWVPEEINKMLTYDDSENIKRNFVSLNSKAKPQMGWVVKPKQDIDTVDGLIKPAREVDNFLNFARNMESKSTPIKSAEFVNANQSNINNNKANVTPDDKSKTELSSSLTIKAKESTCIFFKNSAHKLVNLVSKFNRNKSFQKNVSCQTSDFNLNDTSENALYEISHNKKARFTSQSQTENNLFSSPKKNNYMEEFDFNRKINSPKQERISQRRLSFSPKKIIKNFSQKSWNGVNESRKNFEYYRSYQSEYNGDFSLNLMNDILLNIKSKLEASDRHASSVFREVQNNEKARILYSKENKIHKSAEEFSDVDSPCEIISANADVHIYNRYNNNANSPNGIYSEIEDEKIVFTGSPSIRSLNEISHFYANNDPNSEYAEVRKSIKSKSSKRHSFIVTDKNKDAIPILDFQDIYEPTYAEIEKMNLCDRCSDDSVSVRSSKTSIEQDYLPQKKSNIGLEKLKDKTIAKNECKDKNTVKELYKNQFNYNCNNTSVIEVAEACIIEDETKPVKELVDYFEHSLCHNNTCNQDHSVSYESPNDCSINCHSIDLSNSNTFKELKPLTCDQEDVYCEIYDNEERSNSCPPLNQNTNRKPIENQSCLTYESADCKTKNTFQAKQCAKYNLLKRQFRKSIKKGKSFFKKNMRNYSLNNTINSTSSYDAWEQSNLGITSLFVEDDDKSWQKQLEKAVFICRKLPVLESSTEAAEAERLLLYSKLKIEGHFCNTSVLTDKPSTDYESWINIEDFELPIQSEVEFSDFFNFFYVGVFSNGQKIISTNYAEKHDKLIVFRNCHINFDNISCNTKIICDIYVLRLRKVLSTKITKEQIKAKMEEINCFSDSNEQLLSRFKFQGSFQLFPQNFTPFRMDDSCHREFKNASKFCLHSTKTVNLPTDIDGENSLILNYVNITAKLEIVFSKFTFEGFLNVRSFTSEYYWNKRWCKIDNFILLCWDYPQDCYNKSPIFTFNLSKCVNEKIEIAVQETCPRPRSFCIQLKTTQMTELYFSADNQNDLNYWLNGLNSILIFKKTWMQDNI